MRLLCVLGLAAAAAFSSATAVAATPRVQPLPWPPTVLPHTPPLAPETTGVLPLPPLFVNKITARERIVVGVDDSGEPHSVRVLQRLVLNQLGDYVFGVPAPVESVLPGPGTESTPGQRENQILWEGFSPGHRVLAAWADLRVGESASSLPARIELETTVDGERLTAGERRSGALEVGLTITNATAVTADSFTADPEPVSLAQVVDGVRSAIRRNVFPESLNAGFFGEVTSRRQRVAAPLQVEGTLRFAPGSVELPDAHDGIVRFSGRLDGVQREQLRLRLRGRALNAAPPKIEVEVATAPPADPVDPPGKSWRDALRRQQLGDPRRLLQRAIVLELTYARKRQYDMFLASPDQSGPSSATYVYRSAAPARATGASEPAGETDYTVAWIVLGIGLVAAIPAGAVIWAHS